MPIVISSLLLAASAVLTGISITALPFYDDKTGAVMPLVWFTLALWALFALSLIALRRVPTRSVVVLLVAGSVAIGGAALLGPPNTSTDSARYAWDGIVQRAGISPYAYTPADPELASLRTDWLFPAAVTDADGTERCVGERIMRFETDEGVVCSAINRLEVPTIYPPTSELAFAAIRLITGPEPAYWPMQLAGFIMSLGITLLLVRTLTRLGRDPRWAAIWAWSPLMATEGVTNSHIDILGGLLLLVATVLVTTRRRWWGGIALGAAIAVKLIPVIGAPALLRRGSLPLVIGSVGAFLLLYLPYIVSTGIGVLGYLPGYLSEEGYATGSRFIMLSLVAPGPAALVLAAVLILITALLVWWKTDPTDLWLGQVVMIGTTLLIVTPRYPWYALLLVPLVAMTGRWEWMAVPLALTERLLLPSVDLARITVALAIVLIVAVSLRRAGPGALGRLGRFVRHPLTPQAAPASASSGAPPAGPDLRVGRAPHPPHRTAS